MRGLLYAVNVNKNVSSKHGTTTAPATPGENILITIRNRLIFHLRESMERGLSRAGKPGKINPRFADGTLIPQGCVLFFLHSCTDCSNDDDDDSWYRQMRLTKLSSFFF